MTSFVCPQCGAALEVPSPPPSAVRCKYCRAETPVGSLSRVEVDRGHIDRALDAHATRSRSLMVGIGIALGALSLVTLAVVVLRGSPAAPPAPQSVASATVTAEPVVATPPPPAVITPPPAQERPVPRVRFGGEGTGEGRFSHVKALAVAADGTLYVGDRTQRIQAFDATGKLLRTLTVSTARKPTGPLDGDVTEIEGLAATRDGKLWVSIGYDLVRIDATTGAVEHTTKGPKGKGPPARTCFRDLSIDPRGELHARSACTTTNEYALVHLDAKGRELHRYEDPPDYDQASSGRVAVDGAGRWYVPYGTLSEVRVLEPDGKVFTRFGQRGSGDAEFESFALDAVSLDPTGRVYARDSSEILIFTPEGKFLHRFDPGELGSMRTFAIAGDGTIWVLTGDGVVGAFDPPAL